MAMRSNGNQTLTPLEFEIMQILWNEGGCTVSEVRPQLRAERAYTTVQTMLNVLLRKNKVKRDQEGRAYRYRPTVNQTAATTDIVSDLIQSVFGGSAEALLVTMVDSRQISVEQLARVLDKTSLVKDGGDGGVLHDEVHV